MLWNKESEKDDAMYVDIFALTGIARTARIPESRPLNKCDVISLQKRKEGNVLFAQRRWYPAMEKYNESLCFATATSKDIALIYANRSSCFLQMQLYNEGLKDIELATAAGYPENLIPKLEKRKVDCAKGIESGAQAENLSDKLKLSFEPNENYPCMANVLDFKRNAFRGLPKIVASEDIDPGQIIMLENPIFGEVSQPYTKCFTCSTELTNLTACQKCTVAMFCSEECESDEANVHESVCGLKYFGNQNANDTIFSIIRQILLAIRMFPNADAHMQFVEQAYDPKEPPNPLTDGKSNYRAFFKLSVNLRSFIGTRMDATALCIYNILLKIPKVAEAFIEQKHRRFLMHLIGHHVLISGENASGKSIPFAMEYFDNSCAPTATLIKIGYKFVTLSVRPIRKGELIQLGPDWTSIFSPIDKRFKPRYLSWIKCRCVLCKNMASTSTRKIDIFRKDLDFRYITQNCSNSYDSCGPVEMEQIQKIMEKCLLLLQKYGSTMWCNEIAFVVHTYIKLFHLQFSNLFDQSSGKLIVHSLYGTEQFYMENEFENIHRMLTRF